MTLIGVMAVILRYLTALEANQVKVVEVRPILSATII